MSQAAPRRGTGHSASATEIREEFDRKAEEYEAGRLAPWYRAQGELALQHLPERGPGPLVDVGCGTGWMLRRWASARGGERGVGVDLAPGMVERARHLARAEGVEGLTFLAGDWLDPATRRLVLEELPAPARAITCVSVLHYFADPEEALRGMASLLAPGGKVVVIDRALDGAPLTRAWGLLHRRVIGDHARFHRSEDLQAHMEAAGLERARVEARIRRLHWKGKLATSLVLVSGYRRAR